MEYDTDDTNAQDSMLQRIKESPRTVSALIIILIVAAAIYAFSGDNVQNDANELASNEGTAEEVMDVVEAQDEQSQSEESPSEENAMTDENKATPTPVTKEELEATAKTSPEARKTDQGYVEVAQAGDGVTHLARRATARYLSENDAGYAVSNEHRIYIEDYIKDRTGTKSLAVGAEQTISFDLIKEAVASAQNLSDSQLQNLSQYTSALS